MPTASRAIREKQWAPFDPFVPTDEKLRQLDISGDKGSALRDFLHSLTTQLRLLHQEKSRLEQERIDDQTNIQDLQGKLDAEDVRISVNLVQLSSENERLRDEVERLLKMHTGISRTSDALQERLNVARQEQVAASQVHEARVREMLRLQEEVSTIPGIRETLRRSVEDSSHDRLETAQARGALENELDAHGMDIDKLERANIEINKQARLLEESKLEREASEYEETRLRQENQSYVDRVAEATTSREQLETLYERTGEELRLERQTSQATDRRAIAQTTELLESHANSDRDFERQLQDKVGRIGDLTQELSRSQTELTVSLASLESAKLNYEELRKMMVRAEAELQANRDLMERNEARLASTQPGGATPGTRAPAAPEFESPTLETAQHIREDVALQLQNWEVEFNRRRSLEAGHKKPDTPGRPDAPSPAHTPGETGPSSSGVKTIPVHELASKPPLPESHGGAFEEDYDPHGADQSACLDRGAPTPKSTYFGRPTEQDDLQSLNGSQHLLGRDNADVTRCVEFLQQPPAKQAEDYVGSEEIAIVRLVLASGQDGGGRTMFTRSNYTEDGVRQWAESTFVHRRYREASDALRAITSLEFPESLLGSNPTEVRKAWLAYRTTFILKLTMAISAGAQWGLLLRSMMAASRKERTGNPRIEDYVSAAILDTALMRNPPLHADVLVWKLDISFDANSVHGPDNLAADWEDCTSRLAGETATSCADRVKRAYIKKIDDPRLTTANVWEKPAHAHEISKRTCACLAEDKGAEAQGDYERGKNNQAIYWREWTALQTRYQAGHIKADQLDTSLLCAIHIGSYEAEVPGSSGMPRTRQRSARERRDTGAGPAGNTPTDPKNGLALDRNGVPLDPALRSLWDSAKKKGDNRVRDAIKVLQHPPREAGTSQSVNHIGAPPPPQAPPPGRTAGTQERSTTYVPDTSPLPANGIAPQRYRLVAHPTGKTGNPEDTTWTNDLWGQAIADLDEFDKLRADPNTLKAAALIRPTNMDLNDVYCGRCKSDEDWQWPADACKYCLYRPRAPNDRSDMSHESNWWYGTGRGDHNPYRCQAFKRMIAEGGEIKTYPQAAAAIRNALRARLPPRVDRGGGRGQGAGGRGRGGKGGKGGK